MTGRYFSLVLFAFCTLLALIDPYIFENQAFLLWRVVFWYANGLFMVGFWFLLFVGLAWLNTVTERRLIVPSALLIVVAITVLLHFNYWLAGIILVMPELWKGALYWDILRYAAVAILFETAVATFILPRVLFSMRRKTAAPAGTDIETPPPEDPNPIAEAVEFLEVAGRRVELKTLLYLKSAEHYVEVVTHDATELIRAGLREMIEPLCDECGVQPHRSYWVCRHAIVGLNRVKGAQYLVLQNGEEIPVSRQRKRDVLEWLSSHVAGQVSANVTGRSLGRSSVGEPEEKKGRA